MYINLLPSIGTDDQITILIHSIKNADNTYKTYSLPGGDPEIPSGGTGGAQRVI